MHASVIFFSILSVRRRRSRLNDCIAKKNRLKWAYEWAWKIGVKGARRLFLRYDKYLCFGNMLCVARKFDAKQNGFPSETRGRFFLHAKKKVKSSHFTSKLDKFWPAREWSFSSRGAYGNYSCVVCWGFLFLFQPHANGLDEKSVVIRL